MSQSNYIRNGLNAELNFSTYLVHTSNQPAHARINLKDIKNRNSWNMKYEFDWSLFLNDTTSFMRPQLSRYESIRAIKSLSFSNFQMVFTNIHDSVVICHWEFSSRLLSSEGRSTFKRSISFKWTELTESSSSSDCVGQRIRSTMPFGHFYYLPSSSVWCPSTASQIEISAKCVSSGSLCEYSWA